MDGENNGKAYKNGWFGVTSIFGNTHVWSVGPPSTPQAPWPPWLFQGTSATFLAACRQSSPRGNLQTSSADMHISWRVFICKYSIFNINIRHIIICIIRRIKPHIVWKCLEYITLYNMFICWICLLQILAKQLFRTQKRGMTHSSHTCIPHRQHIIWMLYPCIPPWNLHATPSHRHAGPSTCTKNLSHEAQVFSLWRKHLPSCERTGEAKIRMHKWNLEWYLGVLPHPVTVTTRRLTFLIIFSRGSL